jgi:hypothetical protein
MKKTSEKKEKGQRKKSTAPAPGGPRFLVQKKMKKNHTPLTAIHM